MQRLVSMAMLALTSAAPQCTDTKDWLNQYGAGCEAYLADGHCNGQGFADGHKWTAGEEYGYPELHCCVCGKDVPEEKIDEYHEMRKANPEFQTQVPISQWRAQAMEKSPATSDTSQLEPGSSGRWGRFLLVCSDFGSLPTRL